MNDAVKKWAVYRTRFLVKARPLTEALTFVDVLGREHQGKKGDYLVESSDGVLRIASRDIFEDIYVPLDPGPVPKREPHVPRPRRNADRAVAS